MPSRLAYTTLLIDDYDRAIAYFTRVLGFAVRADERLSATKRWVVVAPPGEGGALLLAEASTPAQRALIGGQGGGRVWLFLHTGDFAAEHARLIAGGVRFEESPRDEPYGRVAVFVDCWGNRWDLVQPSAAAA
jgi:catechol 2,3-dioxygenase-like lactoylglutathione lyase family enzyme